MNEVYLYLTAIKNIDNQNDMILYCAYDFLNEHDEIIEPLKIVKNENGKPDFTKSCHFNLSHSKDYWICAISYEEVGCDIQIMKDIDYSKIVKKAFVEEVTNIEDFYTIWSGKEAYSKLTSLGLADFKNFKIDKHKVFKDGKNVANISYPKFRKDYKLAVCTYQRSNIILKEI